MPPFRFQAKQFYFTYPQCEKSPEEAIRALQGQHATQWVVCGREKHDDGAYHLHMCGVFTEKVSKRGADCFDFVTGQHGNYVSMRAKKQCVKYCTKDGDYVADGVDVEELLKGSESKRSQVARLVIEGKPDEEILEEFPGYFMERQKDIDNLRQFLQARAAEVPDFFDPPTTDHVDWQAVCDWLEQNILQRRQFKAPQLWLYGPSGAGKSSLLMELQRRVRTYVCEYDGDWFDEFNESTVDLIIMDEYRGQYPVTLLNRLTDGTQVGLRRRGRSPAVKKKNLPVIVCSNHPIPECYHRCSGVQLEALHSRFRTIYVDRPGLVWTRAVDFEDEEHGERSGSVASPASEDINIREAQQLPMTMI